LYQRYIKGDCINIDDPVLVNNLVKAKAIPDKTLLLPIQNAIWNLLKYESFVRFKADVKRDMMEPVNERLLHKIKNWNSLVVDLLDIFLDKVNETLQYEEFDPGNIPMDRHNEDKKINQAPFSELFNDKYLFLGFREYLYRQFTDEYLSCFLKINHFKYFADDTNKEELANEIYNTYLKPGSQKGIAIEVSMLRNLEGSLDDPSLKMFKEVSLFLEHRLKIDLYSSYLQSDLYSETNEGTLEYTMSDKKGQTVKLYKNVTSKIRELKIQSNKTESH